jgi:hypothetical protein
MTVAAIGSLWQVSGRRAAAEIEMAGSVDAGVLRGVHVRLFLSDPPKDAARLSTF